MMSKAQLNERGQITIPKAIRDRVNLKPSETVNIDINDYGQIVISKRDILDELNDLIEMDLVKEGYTSYELKEKKIEKKKELANALLERITNAEKEVMKGQYSTLDEVKREFTEE